MEAKLLHRHASTYSPSASMINFSNKSCVQSKPFVKYCHYGRSLRRLAIRSISSSGRGERERLGSMNGLKSEGLGIVDFLKAKSFLVTGATGFLAKVVIEKILRIQPDVGKLFLLIKAKDSDSALQRLKTEIMHSELFRHLRDIHGDKYDEFILKKLVAVAGDVSVDNLGIHDDVADRLVQHVDVILNSAANTTFDERYDVALEINTKGPSRLMQFGKRCKSLQMFLHISTAYVNGQRQGRVMEKSFQMGYSIAKELEYEDAPFLNILDEFELAKKSLHCFSKDISCKTNSDNITKKMKYLGLERARRHGWQDVYAFTKAMGEMFLDYNRGQIPLAVVRPTVIESSYNDPFPGWIEGLRMVDPIIAYYGKGQLTAVVGDPDVALDIIPVDMVANAILAVIAKRAGRSGMEVYHVSSSATNPMTIGELFGMFFQYFKRHPYVDARGKLKKVEENLKLYGKMENLAYNSENKMRNGVSSLHMEKQERVATRARDNVNKRISRMYEFYLTCDWRFDNSNTDGLLEELSEEERMIFGFDARCIEWREYVMKVHIPGLLRYGMRKRRIDCEQEHERNMNHPIIQTSAAV